MIIKDKVQQVSRVDIEAYRGVDVTFTSRYLSSILKEADCFAYRTFVETSRTLSYDFDLYFALSFTILFSKYRRTKIRAEVWKAAIPRNNAIKHIRNLRNFFA